MEANDLLRGFGKLVAGALGLAYIVIGGLILFAQRDYFRLGPMRYILAALIIVYGIYRIYRAFRNPTVVE